MAAVLAGLESMNQRFDSIDQRFDSMDAKFTQRLDSMDQRLDSVDQRFDSVDAKFDALNDDLRQRLAEGFETVNSRFDDAARRTAAFATAAHIRRQLREEVWVMAPRRGRWTVTMDEKHVRVVGPGGRLVEERRPTEPERRRGLRVHARDTLSPLK